MEEAFKRLKHRLLSSFTGKVHPHNPSHGKAPHPGSHLGTEMEIMTAFGKSGGKKRTRRVKSKKSKSKKSKSRSRRH
jgi:hypothetical protein